MRSSSVWASFRFAFAGLWYAALTQRNVRIQLGVGLLVALAAVWLQLPLRDCAVLALTTGLVVSAELANTALETVVNLVSPDYHDLARIAKDVAAAAVLCLALTSIAVGACLLVPPVLMMFGGS